MAIKPIIYKANINLSDFTRDYYDSLHMTIALHPSETLERMMARIIAYCIHAKEGLGFTKGLCDSEAPAIRATELDGTESMWVDVGEPSADKLKKAVRTANEVYVYAFTSKADTWWSLNGAKLQRNKVHFFKFDAEQMAAAIDLVERTMNFSITITENSAFIASEKGQRDITWSALT